ncbi:hypothetical protein fugu_012297 [Takifugu bimaculatus]|uniref:CTLH domain-containing protein n=1 Tax=Takifugu bimaculatus TaxID=433685 RepID=A0A4Z2CA76_9TELE|nr:hypothetical protein fugu_012297 [Takifugu bimaculatus]
MIARFPIGERLGEWQTVLQNMVSSYLVHHGYCATATAFARATETKIQEDQTSIKNRQRIQKLVLAGRVGEAIQVTQQLYPGLLEHNPNLLFVLKCRQFVEMVNGTDGEVCGLNLHSPKSQDCYPAILSPHHGATNTHSHSAGSESPTCSNGISPTNKSKSHSGTSVKYPRMSSVSSSTTSSPVLHQLIRVQFLRLHGESTPQCQQVPGEQNIRAAPRTGQLCGGTRAATERMIQFGRELQGLSEQLCREYGKNTAHKKMLQVPSAAPPYSCGGGVMAITR